MRVAVWIAWIALLGAAGQAGAQDDFVGPRLPEPDSLGVLAAVEPGLRPEFVELGPRLRIPESFLRESPLRIGFRQALARRWAEAASQRVFEEEGSSLKDFSSIDIPIKFPDRIGRVIGQGANLSVSGSENISFGGQTRYQVDEPLTEFGRRSKFPTLDMKQHLKIDLTGTVGEKIHVMVHHDSEIETPLENRIKLRYEGDDDEIIQKVEMGNTNLNLPGSRFVSYSGQQQGLFGAKVTAKLGALDVTAIASKQEGRTAGASFVGAATRDSIQLEDMDYVRDKYFFVVDPYTLGGRGFSRVDVYMDDNNGNNNLDTGALPGYAFIDPVRPPEKATWDTLAYSGNFDVLEVNRDYAVDLRTGEISLLRSLPAGYALAVTFVWDDGSTVGGVDNEGVLRLKMIRPPDHLYDTRGYWWKEPTLKLMRKNVYSLGVSYISEEQVEVRIYRKGSPVDTDIQNQYEYAKILGIDLRDENGVLGTPGNGWKTDGYADGGRVYGELGLLMFPDLQPFDPQVVTGDRPEVLEERNPVIYDEPIGNLKRTENSMYYMIVRYSTPQTTFKLPHINILENSEVVTLNGNRLTRNVDYEIYYDIGQIRFRTEEASRPDAEISVDYQYVPFLALAQQSLLGVQGIYKFSDDSHIGSLWLYQSKKSPEDRPRLGQEPSRTVMGDVNAKFDFHPSVMTSMVNALPFVSSDSPSKLSLAGELGMSFPNPNTKGDVYVEDMEGVQDLRSFSLMRESWVPASPPGDSLTWEHNRRIWWYVKDREVREQDLFPKAESRPGESYIPVMEIDVKDFSYKGYGPDTAKVIPDTTKQWAGLMRLVSKTGADYSELRFFEVWLRQKKGTRGVMHVDLGAISENFYHPWAADSLNTEDKDHDGQLSVDENTGYDGVFDGHPGDDPYDDWSYTEGRYEHINGTERNPRTIPDTEDLDQDGNLDTDNVHFRLSFDLSDTSYIANESNGWRLYRVPLAEAVSMGGSPSWRSIKYLRFFFTGVDSPSVFQLAYMQIAGTSWLEEGVRDSSMVALTPEELLPGETFEISAKNTRDDPNYDPPYDPGKDPEGFRKREQSLVFNFRNLESHHSGSVYKIIPGKANDYTQYQTLAFYVHGDELAASQDIDLFVRFGSDSINFYEYAVRVEPGWKSVAVPLADLTNLKTLDTTRVSIYGKSVLMSRLERPHGWMAVYGAPSITRVSRISAGVLNRGGAASPSVGMEVWFDDLRLTDVRKDAGFAGRMSVGASFGDVITMNLDYERSDTEFQTLSGGRSGSDNTRYSIGASTSLERFMPIDVFALPFSVRYNKTSSLPTLASRSDIVLTPEQRKEQEKSSVDDYYRLGFSKKKKSGNTLLRLTLDAMSASVSFARKRGISPELADTSSGYNGDFNYNFTPWWDHNLRIFRGYRISYLPENVSVTVNGSTKNTGRENFRQDVPREHRYTRNIDGNFGLGFKPLIGPSLDTDYSMKMSRDLDTNKDVPILSSIGLGRETKRNQKVRVTLKRSVGKWMQPTLSYDATYDENAEPSVRGAGDPASVRRASVDARSSVDLLLVPSAAFPVAVGRADTTGFPLHKYLISKIPEIRVGYVLNRIARYQKVLARPDLNFQLGLDTQLDEDLIYKGSTGSAQQSDEHVQTTAFDASSDFQPVNTVSLEANFKKDRTEKIYAGQQTFTTTQVWPDLNGNISTTKVLSFLGDALRSTSIAFGYQGTQTERGSGTSDIVSRTKQAEWLPLLGWDGTWSNGLRTTLNLRHSSSETQDFKGGGSRKSSRATTFTFSLSHSFSAPQGMYIPLAGRTLKFKSNLTLNLDFSYSAKQDRTPSANNRIDTDTRTFSIVPRASYSFSQNVTGSANARFEQMSNRKLGQTWRTIGLGASVLIRF